MSAAEPVTGHEAHVRWFQRLGQAGKLFRARCSCGWRSNPARSLHAAARAAETHVVEVTA